MFQGDLWYTSNIAKLEKPLQEIKITKIPYV